MNWIDKEYHEQDSLIEPWMKPGKGYLIPDTKCNCDAYCWVGGIALLAALVICCFGSSI